MFLLITAPSSECQCNHVIVSVITPSLPPTAQIEEEVCASFRASLPEEYLTILGDEDLRRLLCLGAYVLMLGRCCRGWGQQRDEGRREEGRREEGRGRLQSDSRGCPVVPRPPKPSYHSDPLQRYGAGPRQLPLSPLKRARQAAMGGGRLDVGTFLVGVEVSGRESTPRATEGLLGPLTNGEWGLHGATVVGWPAGHCMV